MQNIRLILYVYVKLAAIIANSLLRILIDGHHEKRVE